MAILIGTLRPPDITTAVGDAHRSLQVAQPPAPLEPVSVLEPVSRHVVESWLPLLAPDTDALDAELLGARFLGESAATMPHLVAQAELSAQPAALAMLRVLAVLGPSEMRAEAGEAADRLIGSGLAEPRWVKTLGRPRLGPCYGYADPFGAQETVACTFSYAKRSHVVLVLVDHDLGGGVKDCGVFADGQARGIRLAYQRAARNAGLQLEIFPPQQACLIVARALDREPCPVTEDQIGHVRDYLHLLRQRCALLAAG